MRIEQDKEAFRPIAIVLETEEDARAMASIIDDMSVSFSTEESSPKRDLCTKLSNWFIKGHRPYPTNK